MDRKTTFSSPSRTRLGFTLVEVIVVMVMVIFIAGVVAPSVAGVLPSVRLSRAGEELLASLGKARTDAVLTGRRQRVYFRTVATPEAAVGHYLAYEPDPLSEPGTFVRIQKWESELAEGLRFDSIKGAAEDAEKNERYLEFDADGACPAATIVLARESGERVTIEIEAATGLATFADEVKP